MSCLIAPLYFDRGSKIAEQHPLVALIRCGQHYEAESITGTLIVQISCPEFNGTDTTITAYKDGVEIDGFTGSIQFGPVPPPSDDIFGTYTFVSENNCGRDVAVTRITRKGLCLWLWVYSPTMDDT